MSYLVRGKVPNSSSEEGSSKQPSSLRPVNHYFFAGPNSSFAPSPASSQRSQKSTAPAINWAAPTNETTLAARRSNVHRSPTRQKTGTARAKFKWIKGELIGKGSHGRVYMGLNVNTGQVMAVKQVELPQTAIDRMKNDMKAIVEALREERETLKDLDHENIVQYLGYEENEETLNIFLQYISGGTIGSCLKQYGKFNEQVTKHFTGQILSGLVYLHDRGIIHRASTFRDLKSDNILVEESGTCKLSDFGISKKLVELKKRAYSMQGTTYWMAPEVFRSDREGYDSKVDIWSVGCVVLEMWTAKRPWSGYQLLDLIGKFTGPDPSPPPVPDNCNLPPSAEDFRQKCFQLDPETRPPASELQNHPYLDLPPGWTFPGMSNMGASVRGMTGPSESRRVTRMRSALDVNKANVEVTDRFPGSLNLSFPREGQRPPSRVDRTAAGPRNARPSLAHRASFHVNIPRGPSPPLVTIEPPAPRKEQKRREDNWMERPRSTSVASDSSGSQRSSQSASRPVRRLVVYNPDTDDRREPEQQPDANARPYIFEPQPLPSVNAFTNYPQLLPPIRSQTYGPDSSVMTPASPTTTSPTTVHNSHLSFPVSESSYSSSANSIWQKPPKRQPSTNRTLSRIPDVYDTQPLNIPKATAGRQSHIGETRPAIGDVVRQLDTYFPGHNLDETIVQSPSESVSSTRKSVKAKAKENNTSFVRQTRLWDIQVEEIKAPR